MRKRLRKKLYKSGYLFTVAELKSATFRAQLANKAKSRLMSDICRKIKTVDSILNIGCTCGYPGAHWKCES